jgi:two-component system, OmpR family, response regulator
MSKGRVIVIESDEWVATLLAEALGEHGYEVVEEHEALSGFRQICESAPDCIICDVELDDFDGFWVAQRVRSEPPPVSTTPFLFLRSAEDQDSPLRAFHVGADVQMTKPFRLEEVIAQVDALVDMAKRMQDARSLCLSQSLSSSPTDALHGSLGKMSLVTVLTVLEMERHSGELALDQEGAHATLEITRGFLSGAIWGGEPKDAVLILRQVLQWKEGRFAFRPGPDRPPPEGARPVAGVLIEAVQFGRRTNAPLSVHNAGVSPHAAPSAHSSSASKKR